MSRAPLLIVFLRKPELGKVKTRLAATLGEQKALAVYERLLQHTLEQVAPLNISKQAWSATDDPIADLVISYGFSTHVQVGNDLGERMQYAFSKGFADRHRPVLIIGTDCPGLSTELIQEAIDALKTNDSVLGPTRDGGYYLLGLNEPLTEVFTNKAWSTEHVREETLANLGEHGRSVRLLKKLIDIDTEEDLNDVEGW